ncbi:hypothetical protein BC829DRAFT_429215 [Chytridium lagenaria]|nr:hypothetical protein BC829DRAFT_429215 [Chytridium lagenaria]
MELLLPFGELTMIPTFLVYMIMMWPMTMFFSKAVGWRAWFPFAFKRSPPLFPNHQPMSAGRESCSNQWQLWHRILGYLEEIKNAWRLSCSFIQSFFQQQQPQQSEYIYEYDEDGSGINNKRFFNYENTLGVPMLTREELRCRRWSKEKPSSISQRHQQQSSVVDPTIPLLMMGYMTAAIAPAAEPHYARVRASQERVENIHAFNRTIRQKTSYEIKCEKSRLRLQQSFSFTAQSQYTRPASPVIQPPVIRPTVIQPTQPQKPLQCVTSTLRPTDLFQRITASNSLATQSDPVTQHFNIPTFNDTNGLSCPIPSYYNLSTETQQQFTDGQQQQQSFQYSSQQQEGLSFQQQQLHQVQQHPYNHQTFPLNQQQFPLENQQPQQQQYHPQQLPLEQQHAHLFVQQSPLTYQHPQQQPYNHEPLTLMQQQFTLENQQQQQQQYHPQQFPLDQQQHAPLFMQPSPLTHQQPQQQPYNHEPLTLMQQQFTLENQQQQQQQYHPQQFPLDQQQHAPLFMQQSPLTHQQPQQQSYNHVSLPFMQQQFQLGYQEQQQQHHHYQQFLLEQQQAPPSMQQFAFGYQQPQQQPYNQPSPLNQQQLLYGSSSTSTAKLAVLEHQQPQQQQYHHQQLPLEQQQAPRFMQQFPLEYQQPLQQQYHHQQITLEQQQPQQLVQGFPLEHQKPQQQQYHHQPLSFEQQQPQQVAAPLEDPARFSAPSLAPLETPTPFPARSLRDAAPLSDSNASVLQRLGVKPAVPEVTAAFTVEEGVGTSRGRSREAMNDVQRPGSSKRRSKKMTASELLDLELRNVRSW